MRFATLYAVAIMLFASTGSAHAYLDPGTGSILLQGVIGAIAGGLFIARMYWAKFKAILGLSPAMPSGAEHGTDDSK